ncbi:Immune-associated nucleotide-binding protein 4 [Linum perenne]
MVRNGIHAVILVLSVSNRFREEEEAAFRGVQSLFGPKIIDYLIIAFTGGDQLEDTATLDDYLGPNCPRPLKVSSLIINGQFSFLCMHVK